MISTYGYQDIVQYAEEKDLEYGRCNTCGNYSKCNICSNCNDASEYDFDAYHYASIHHKEITEWVRETMDERLEQLWDELGDVAVCTGHELYESDPVKYADYQYGQSLVIDSEWNGFPIGTDTESIWHWFDERHSKGVGWLMNEYEPEYE